MIERNETILANFAVTASEDFAGETVVIHFERGTYFSLRGGAGPIWSLLQNPMSVGNIVDAAREHKDALPAEFESTLTAFVGKLAEHDLITKGSTPAQTPVLSAETIVTLAEPPDLEIYTDLSELIAMDPVHEIDILTGWPAPPPQAKQKE